MRSRASSRRRPTAIGLVLLVLLLPALLFLAATAMTRASAEGCPGAHCAFLPAVLRGADRSTPSWPPVGPIPPPTATPSPYPVTPNASRTPTPTQARPTSTSSATPTMTATSSVPTSTPSATRTNTPPGGGSHEPPATGTPTPGLTPLVGERFVPIGELGRGKANRSGRSQLWFEYDLVFRGKSGGVNTRGVINTSLRAGCRELDIPVATVHGLRHTYATLLHEHGEDIVNIQHALGHRRVSVTVDMYVHPNDAMQRGVAGRLQGFLHDAGGRRKEV